MISSVRKNLTCYNYTVLHCTLYSVNILTEIHFFSIKKYQFVPKWCIVNRKYLVLNDSISYGDTKTYHF